MKSLMSILILGMGLSAFSETAVKGDKLNYKTVIDLSASKGVTFFTLMREKIKPALDGYARKGFKVAGSDVVDAALENVGKKVYDKAIKAAGSREDLLDIAEALNSRGEIVTLYNLPQKISSAAKSRVDIWDLSTFFALVSGGGVAVKINDSNFYYNVNYGTGEQAKDEMTGRSFGASPLRDADDVSDKVYLTDLEKYVRTTENPAELYRTILEILTDSNPVNYSKLSELGQSVATDFLAVYTAEEDRHLMSDLKSHAWDVALLEVTLLSAYHAGQDKIMVMYGGELRSSVPNQVSGCKAAMGSKIRAASVIDWWQFSKSTNPEHCNRSGLNITKSDFRLLGKYISEYERKYNPTLVAKVESYFKYMDSTGNLFSALSSYLINFKTPRQLGTVGYALAKEYTAFLMQVKADANKISSYILKQQPKTSASSQSAGGFQNGSRL